MADGNKQSAVSNDQTGTKCIEATAKATLLKLLTGIDQSSVADECNKETDDTKGEKVSASSRRTSLRRKNLSWKKRLQMDGVAVADLPRTERNFITKSDFTETVRTPPPNEARFCYKCAIYIRYQGTTNHIWRQHMPSRYVCTGCDFKSSEIAAVRYHMKSKRHDDEEKAECVDLKSKLQTDYEKQFLECFRLADRSKYRTRELGDEALTMKNRDKRHRCLKCSQLVRTTDTSMHVRARHMKPQFACPICFDTFAYKQGAKKHIAVNHKLSPNEVIDNRAALNEEHRQLYEECFGKQCQNLKRKRSFADLSADMDSQNKPKQSRKTKQRSAGPSGVVRYVLDDDPTVQRSSLANISIGTLSTAPYIY